MLKKVPAVGNLIRTGRWHQIYSTMEAHRQDGLITLERHLVQLARDGRISGDDALRYANEPTMI